MKDTTRNRRSSRRNNSDLGGEKLDIRALLSDDSSSSGGDVNLESIFRRQVTNPFSGPDTMAKVAAKNIAEEREMEELSRADTSKIYTTGYSIHMLTPYILIMIIVCVGFFIVDRYFFNIIEFLSEDIRYKIPAYGMLILLASILIYLFIKKCLEYMTFEMIVTKYKIVQGSKRTTVKNELPYYSIQEFINDRGLFGRWLNYGNLSIYLTSRRNIKFENLHGAQYVYDIIQRLKYGTTSEALEKNDKIAEMINGAEKIENMNKQRQNQQDADPADMTFNLSDLGFTEEELREFGMSSSSLSTSKPSTSSRNRRARNSNEATNHEEIEQDVIELEENGSASHSTERESRRNRIRRSRR